MALHILKFGGTSVANLTRIKHITNIIAQYRYHGHQVVVVSAMEGITNQLVAFADTLGPQQKTEEHDLVYATGEQVTAGLVALSLQAHHFRARSFLAWQIPILTDDTPTYARIQNIPTEALQGSLDEGVVPIIAGFQGVSAGYRLTTLGRGGSDTTAVALAVALQADWCDIYTDVDGVYTADPAIIPQARRHGHIDYHCMFEMAANGAKVLQSRCVELAMRHRVPLRVLSSFVHADDVFKVHGTQIGDYSMEKIRLTGITHLADEILVSVQFITTQVLKNFWDFVGHRGLSLDFVQHTQQSNLSDSKQTSDLTFTCKKNEAEALQEFFNNHRNELNLNRFDTNIIKLSLIGVGIKGNPFIVQEVMRIMDSLACNIYGLHVSEVRLMVVINQNGFEQVMQAIHHHFQLDQLHQAA